MSSEDRSADLERGRGRSEMIIAERDGREGDTDGCRH